jgi:3D (Asp-Asp-Asp) domain-containing protein
MVENCNHHIPIFSRVLTAVCLTTLFQFAACAQSSNESAAPTHVVQEATAKLEEVAICEPKVALPQTTVAIAEPSPEQKLVAVKFSEPEPKHALSPRQFKASAYSIHGRTRSGVRTAPGTMAADPRVLPLGTVVQVNAGKYSGVYTVHDTGGAIKGNRVDVWLPTNKEARRFGRRAIKLVVLQYPSSNAGQNAPTNK